MKNWIFIGAVLALGWYCYMRVVLDYLPNEKSKAWVEELRLGIENGILSIKFSYTPPLPPDQITMPPQGISQDFRITRVSGPSPTDHDTARFIVYEVKFDKSLNATKSGLGSFEYRLVMQDMGSYFTPDWQVVEFHPAGHKVRGKRRAA